MQSCSVCGAVAPSVDSTGDGGGPPGDRVAEGWSFTVTERGLQWQCGRCVREHIRSIEAKLPEEYWE